MPPGKGRKNCCTMAYPSHEHKNGTRRKDLPPRSPEQNMRSLRTGYNRNIAAAGGRKSRRVAITRILPKNNNRLSRRALKQQFLVHAHNILTIIRGCDFLCRISFIVNYGNKTILMSTVQIIFFVFFFPFRQIRRKSLLLPVNSPAFRFGLFVKRRFFMYSECEFAWIISITGKRAG